MDDAAQCVSKGPSFIKGYYRLATAQTELLMYDDAINTLNMAMSKEPGKLHAHCPYRGGGN